MGIILWFTGLSGSGKTTIANLLKAELELLGKKVGVLDGDTVREMYPKKLGFSRKDIRENNRRVAKLAKKQAMNQHFVLVPIISPYREDRENAREIVGENFVEVYVNCSLEECIRRDAKGLYQEAFAGKRDKLIGMDGSENPYEAPLKPDIEIKSYGQESEASVSYLKQFLIDRGYI